MATGEKPSSSEYDKVVQKGEQLKKDAKSYAQNLFNPTKAKDIKEFNIIQERANFIETAYIIGGGRAMIDRGLSKSAENEAAHYRDKLALGKTKIEKQEEYKAFLTGYIKYRAEFKK